LHELPREVSKTEGGSTPVDRRVRVDGLERGEQSATPRRIEAAAAFLEYIKELRPFSEADESRSLKAELDASDAAWHDAYDVVRRLILEAHGRE
jgi:hypothetical protein